MLYITDTSVSIDDIKWTPEGLSIQPKVEGNFDLQNVKIKYKCGDEQLDAGSSSADAAESTAFADDAESTFSFFPNCLHVLKITWQETLKRVRATATDDHGNTATCTENIPKTPGKAIHGMSKLYGIIYAVYYVSKVFYCFYTHQDLKYLNLSKT